MLSKERIEALCTDGMYAGVNGDQAEWAELQALAIKALAPEETAWKPIDTAPLGKMVWLWHRAWRHPFPGQRCGENGAVVVDTCTVRATMWNTFATHWREMDEPSREPQSREDQK